MNLFLKFFVGVLILLGIAGCNEKSSGEDNVFKVGTISGPETEVMETAKKVAKEKYHLNIEVVTFTDYALPNTALNEGSLDANAFQHEAYLNETIKARHYDLVPIAKTFVYPMGLYSRRFKTLDALPLGAKVAIPNDPSNEARALLLLEQAGLIKLKACEGLKAAAQCIGENPKHIEIVTLRAAQLPRSLADVDLAAINTNYAAGAGLLPGRDALFAENKSSVYANVIVVRGKDKADPRVKLFVQSFQSPEVIDAAKQLFHGEAVPAW